MCHLVQAGSENLYYGKGKPTLQWVPVWFGKVTSVWVYMDSCPFPPHHTHQNRMVPQGRTRLLSHIRWRSCKGRKGKFELYWHFKPAQFNQPNLILLACGPWSLPPFCISTHFVMLHSKLWHKARLPFVCLFIYLFVVILPQRTKRQE